MITCTRRTEFAKQSTVALALWVSIYGRSNLFYKTTHFDPNLQDRRWAETDAIEDGYSFSLFTDSYGSVKLKL